MSINADVQARCQCGAIVPLDDLVDWQGYPQDCNACRAKQNIEDQRQIELIDAERRRNSYFIVQRRRRNGH